MEPSDWDKNDISNQLDFDPFKPGAVTEESDLMSINQQKNIIANVISGARATLGKPSRPFTPADQDRHLFGYNEYSERPTSSYKTGQVADDAIENFTRSSTSDSSISKS